MSVSNYWVEGASGEADWWKTISVIGLLEVGKKKIYFLATKVGVYFMEDYVCEKLFEGVWGCICFRCVAEKHAPGPTEVWLGMIFSYT